MLSSSQESLSFFPPFFPSSASPSSAVHLLCNVPPIYTSATSSMFICTLPPSSAFFSVSFSTFPPSTRSSCVAFISPPPSNSLFSSFSPYSFPLSTPPPFSSTYFVPSATSSSFSSFSPFTFSHSSPAIFPVHSDSHLSVASCSLSAFPSSISHEFLLPPSLCPPFGDPLFPFVSYFRYLPSSPSTYLSPTSLLWDSITDRQQCHHCDGNFNYIPLMCFTPTQTFMGGDWNHYWRKVGRFSALDMCSMTDGKYLYCGLDMEHDISALWFDHSPTSLFQSQWSILTYMLGDTRPMTWEQRDMHEFISTMISSLLSAGPVLGLP